MHEWHDFLLWFPAAFGLVLLGFAIRERRRFSRFIAQADATLGTVVGFVHGPVSDEDSLFTPVIRYQVGDDTHEYVSKLSQRPAGFEIGDSVEIWYSKTGPRSAMLCRESRFLSWGLIAMGTGCLFIFAVFQFVIFYQRFL